MIYLRSTLFQVFFYLLSGLMFIGCAPLLLFDRSGITWMSQAWAKLVVWTLRVFAGITYEIRGKEHMPDGPMIVASKHQSVWDTIIYFLLVRDIAMVGKQELGRIPIYGSMGRKYGMILIDRSKGVNALKDLIEKSQKILDQRRSILIFPEGTRTPPGGSLPYQRGIAYMYEKLDAPVVPAALNSGMFWSRRSFLKKPGTILLEFRPPIEAGLSRREFMQRLTNEIELTSNQLMKETNATSHGDQRVSSSSPPVIRQKDSQQ